MNTSATIRVARMQSAIFRFQGIERLTPLSRTFLRQFSPAYEVADTMQSSPETIVEVLEVDDGPSSIVTGSTAIDDLNEVAIRQAIQDLGADPNRDIQAHTFNLIVQLDALPRDLYGEPVISLLAELGAKLNEVAEFGSDPEAVGLAEELAKIVHDTRNGIVEDCAHEALERERMNMDRACHAQKWGFFPQFMDCSPFWTDAAADNGNGVAAAKMDRYEARSDRPRETLSIDIDEVESQDCIGVLTRP